MTYSIRSIEPSDQSHLWEFLYQAIYAASPVPREIVHQPELAKYADAWGRLGDLGFMAVALENQASVGAAWVRLFTVENRGYGYIDEATPELAIAVLPEYRGQGIGTTLLMHLFEQAKHHYSAISLSVSVDNPAMRLYRRLGFEAVAQEGDSMTMKRDL